MLPNIIYYLAAKAAKHLFPLSTAATNWILKNGIGYPAVLYHVDFSMETVLYFFPLGGWVILGTGCRNAFPVFSDFPVLIPPHTSHRD